MGYTLLNPGGTPKAGGTYNLAVPADFDSFDPHLSIAGATAYFPRLYNALINRSPVDNSFEFNDLSTQLEQPDDTTYIFTMRPGVKIGPNKLGVPERDMDAADVKATFDRIRNLKQSNAYGFVGQNIASIDPSADGSTLTIKTPQPYGYFFFRIGGITNCIVPKELLDKPDRMKSASAGGGPFVLNPGGYTEGQSALLSKNPSYYRKDDKNGDARLPYVDAISVRVIFDRAALRTAFQSGQTDEYSAQNVTEKNSLGNRYTVARSTTNTFISFTMNPLHDPWRDDRIRMAAMYALDRSEYARRIYAGEAKPNGLVHWSLGDYALSPDELQRLQPYDPAKARALIKAATGQDTLSIKVIYPADATIEEHNLHLPIWLSQMQDAGFNVEAEPLAFGTFLDNYTNKTYDAALALNIFYETAEIELDFESKHGPNGSDVAANGIGALYQDIEDAITASKRIADPTEQAAKVKDVQRMIYAKGPMFLPIVTPYAFTLYQPHVRNIPAGIGTTSPLYLNQTWLDT